VSPDPVRADALAPDRRAHGASARAVIGGPRRADGFASFHGAPGGVPDAALSAP
jgi:hypothetical protein